MGIQLVRMALLAAEKARKGDPVLYVRGETP